MLTESGLAGCEQNDMHTIIVICWQHICMVNFTHNPTRTNRHSTHLLNTFDAGSSSVVVYLCVITLQHKNTHTHAHTESEGNTARCSHHSVKSLFLVGWLLKFSHPPLCPASVYPTMVHKTHSRSVRAHKLPRCFTSVFGWHVCEYMMHSVALWAARTS